MIPTGHYDIVQKPSGRSTVMWIGSRLHDSIQFKSTTQPNDCITLQCSYSNKWRKAYIAYIQAILDCIIETVEL